MSPRNARRHTHKILPTWTRKPDLHKDDINRRANIHKRGAQGASTLVKELQAAKECPEWEK